MHNCTEWRCCISTFPRGAYQHVLLGWQQGMANHNAQYKDAGLNLLICAQARMGAAVAFLEGQDGQLNLLLTLSAVGQNGEDKQVPHRFTLCAWLESVNALLVSHGSS